MEQWKTLNGVVECGEHYEVSSEGRVRSVDRVVVYENRFGTTTSRKLKGKILRQAKTRGGYLVVGLRNQKGSKQYRVNRLVALAFIPNDDPVNKPHVGHDDENNINNKVENLYWTNCVENNNRPKRLERLAKVGEENSYAVVGIAVESGEYIRYPNIKTAVADGFNGSAIRNCLCKKMVSSKTHKGYYWHKESEFATTQKQI